jgi:hypothetical protein
MLTHNLKLLIFMTVIEELDLEEDSVSLCLEFPFPSENSFKDNFSKDSISLVPYSKVSKLNLKSPNTEQTPQHFSKAIHTKDNLS